MSSSITAPLGFRAAATACGIKPQGLDLALIVADRCCAAAGVFTTNLVQAAPIQVSRVHLSSRRARAVVINAGNANAATGAAGLSDAREMAALTAQAVGCPPEEVVVASTGVIGLPLPMDRLRVGIPRAAAGLNREHDTDAARAIMTTDTAPKETVVEFSVGGQDACLGGMAKGAGMIAPDMATMLAFFTTDVSIDAELLQRALAEAVGESLNRITVDGDTSTNDMALVLASGASSAPAIAMPGPDYDAFKAALIRLARRLARMIVRGGEGATRVAEVRVEGARSAAEADRVARVVAESPLVKTALHGSDPNWGRILAAVGRAGVVVDPERIDVLVGDVWVAQGGRAREYDEEAARKALLEDPAHLCIRLGAGTATGWMWTCDLSKEYVDINASYRS